MGKSIKQLADDIGVSKPTISKIIDDLGIEPQKIGNRFILSEEDAEAIKSKITLQKSESVSPKSQNEIANETQKTAKLQEISEISQNEPTKSQITILGEQTELLRTTLDVLQGQLSEKDKQIAKLQAELSAERQHSRDLSDRLVVLTDQAQQLHAGTIQERLTTQVVESSPQTEDNVDLSSQLDESEPMETSEKKKSWRERLGDWIAGRK